jgi:hypothetical protein
VLLSILLFAGFPAAVRSQPTTKPNVAAPGDKPAPNPNGNGNAGDKPAAPAPAAAEPEKPLPQVETFRDERAEKLLANTFPSLGKSGRPKEIDSLKSMAAGAMAVDRQLIERVVQHLIAVLTNHSNIKAVIDPSSVTNPNAAANFAISNATNDLVEPILTARGVGNTGFLSTYNQVLLQMLPPLLENHLLPRIEAMLVLSQTGTPEAVPIFIKQLNDPDQTVWVDLWAARGLTKIQQVTNYNLDTSRAITAAKAVADFLEREKNLPWPVQYRALEALGALRQASTPRPANGQPEMAATATQFLTDPDARLEVRAEAGKALGMMQVQAGINRYNYSMIAHQLGEIAATLGERVRKAYPENVNQAESLTALLMSQIYQAFEGVENARDSGLLKATHPNAIPARSYIKQVYDRTKPVAAASVKLVRGPGGQAQQNLKDLENKVSELKGWLEKNQPSDAWLVPGGPVFPLKGAPVVKAPDGRAQVAGQPAGRGQ